MITIRRAVIEDIPAIMDFIDIYWKKGHILARDRNFFEWQFVEDGNVNAYIGEEDGVIYGFEGVILYNHSSNPDISCTVWKVIKSGNPRLGLDIQDYLCRDLCVRYTCSVGLTLKVKKMCALQGQVLATMDHYYRLNDIDDYRIAVVKKKQIAKTFASGYQLVRVENVAEMKRIIPEKILLSGIMSKDYRYIERRYFLNPIYQYDIYKVINSKGKSDCVVIFREEQANDRKCYKFVDVYGNLERIMDITYAIDEIMKENDYEYVDIYSFGVDTNIYEKAGFNRCVDGGNIIPNYFHPFVQENIELDLVDPMIEGFRMFLGDGDQDRPC